MKARILIKYIGIAAWIGGMLTWEWIGRPTSLAVYTTLLLFGSVFFHYMVVEGQLEYSKQLVANVPGSVEVDPPTEPTENRRNRDT